MVLEPHPRDCVRVTGNTEIIPVDEKLAPRQVRPAKSLADKSRLLPTSDKQERAITAQSCGNRREVFDGPERQSKANQQVARKWVQ